MNGGYLFPPELVPLLRARLADSDASLVDVDDALLTELLTVVFFAGLLTHERQHHPIRVAFAPHSRRDGLIGGSPADPTPMLIYRWSTLRLDPDRPFSVAELVKLAVVTRGDRMYTKVEVSPAGMRVVGIARQGTKRDHDPYLEVVAARPGFLSVRHGDRPLVEYEHGKINDNPPDVFFEAGRVRRALERCASNAELGASAVPDYLGTVRALVREMAAHGTGGILIISGERSPQLPLKASYRTESDAAIGELLQYLDASADARRGTTAAPTHAATQLRRVLRDTFRTEAERWVSEFGGFTAMDGATVLDCALGLRGFGVVLPVAKDVEVVEAEDGEATQLLPYDLTTHGTRHRAAVNYALDFPGSVVFLASHDGPVCCLVADEDGERVHLWRLGDGGVL